jgi:predicted NBD/HSP70 family sugar kinase
MQKYYLALDFGGSSVKCAVLTSEGEILERFVLSAKAESYEKWLDSLEPKFFELNEKYSLQGIGISTCGAVDVDTGIIHGASALPYIHGFNVKRLYAERFKVPVEIENDACCAALAEGWLGAASDTDSFCLLVLGSGLGGAIVSDGELIKGHQLHGGEIGYSILRYEHGEPLIYSNAASTRALVDKAANVLGCSSTEINGMTVFELYESGNPEISEVVEQWFLDLATILFNIQYTVDPEKMLIGGAISKRDNLLNLINAKLDLIMEKLTLAKVRPSPAICQFGNDANLIGALKHFLIRQG